MPSNSCCEKTERSAPLGEILTGSKYLNNVIEQDHRNLKMRLRPMLGLKRFRSATTTIAGIELMHAPIRKGQFDLSRLGVQGKAAGCVR